jgi:hypothetical protein
MECGSSAAAVAGNTAILWHDIAPANSFEKALKNP